MVPTAVPVAMTSAVPTAVPIAEPMVGPPAVPIAVPIAEPTADPMAVPTAAPIARAHGCAHSRAHGSAHSSANSNGNSRAHGRAHSNAHSSVSTDAHRQPLTQQEVREPHGNVDGGEEQVGIRLGSLCHVLVEAEGEGAQRLGHGCLLLPCGHPADLGRLLIPGARRGAGAQGARGALGGAGCGCCCAPVGQGAWLLGCSLRRVGAGGLWSLKGDIQGGHGWWAQAGRVTPHPPASLGQDGGTPAASGAVCAAAATWKRPLPWAPGHGDLGEGGHRGAQVGDSGEGGHGGTRVQEAHIPGPHLPG